MKLISLFFLQLKYIDIKVVQIILKKTKMIQEQINFNKFFNIMLLITNQQFVII